MGKGFLFSSSAFHLSGTPAAQEEEGKECCVPYVVGSIPRAQLNALSWGSFPSLEQYVLLPMVKNEASVVK